MTTISKLQPHRTMYLRGFDRRGAAASGVPTLRLRVHYVRMLERSVDFAVAVLFDADDTYGHLFTSRYLPDFDLAGVKLGSRSGVDGVSNPISLKYASVPWGSLGSVKRTVSAGVVDGDYGDCAAEHHGHFGRIGGHGFLYKSRGLPPPMIGSISCTSVTRCSIRTWAGLIRSRQAIRWRWSRRRWRR